MDVWSLAEFGGYALIVLGLIGSVVPILPGPFVIWLGAVLWAWGDGFTRLGWPTLVLLLLLAMAAWASDILLNLVVSRRGGASWKAIAAAIVGGVAGGFLLSGVFPILGTLVGAILGSLGAMYGVEYMNTGDRQRALASMRTYLGSMVLASLLEIFVALMMVGIFAWQALL